MAEIPEHYNISTFDETTNPSSYPTNPSGYCMAISDSSNAVVDDEGEDSVESPEVENDIKLNLKGPGKFYGNPLYKDHQPEAELTGGIHLFHGVEEALKKTFPGWPDELGPFEAFCQSVDALLKARVGNTSAEQLLKEPRFKSVHDDLHRFMKAGLFRDYENKPQFHSGLLKIMSRGVKYLDEEQRTKYLIDLGPPLKRGNDIFDTKTLVSRKAQKSIGGNPSAGFTMLKNAGKTERCMWVMTERKRIDGYQFYSHFGKIARFHHSSFSGGQLVTAAGEWFVEQGKITLINGMSGHYRPTTEMFLEAFSYLNSEGALAGAEVQVFKKSNLHEERISAQEFRRHTHSVLREYQLFA